MRLYFDLDKERFITRSGYEASSTGFERKVASGGKLEVEFSRGGDAEDLPVGVQVRFGLKERGKYDGVLLALAETDDFTKVADGVGMYSAPLNLNVAGIRDLLNIDGDDGNDLEFVVLMGQMDWRVDPSDAWSKSPTLDVKILNSVLQDTDGMEMDPVPLYPVAADVVSYADQAALGKTEGEKKQARLNTGAAQAYLKEFYSDQYPLPQKPDANNVYKTISELSVPMLDGEIVEFDVLVVFDPKDNDYASGSGFEGVELKLGFLPYENTDAGRRGVMGEGIRQRVAGLTHTSASGDSVLPKRLPVSAGYMFAAESGGAGLNWMVRIHGFVTATEDTAFVPIITLSSNAGAVQGQYTTEAPHANSTGTINPVSVQGWVRKHENTPI